MFEKWYSFLAGINHEGSVNGVCQKNFFPITRQLFWHEFLIETAQRYEVLYKTIWRKKFVARGLGVGCKNGFDNLGGGANISQCHGISYVGTNNYH